LFTVETLAIGSEILSGQVLDTNSHWICGQVTEMGGAGERAHIVRDSVAAIAEVLLSALSRRPDSILIFGGLGPTSDDVTLFAVASALKREMHLHLEAKEWVQRRYEELARSGHVESAEMTRVREKMAYLPQGAEPLQNLVGTAPGVRITEGECEIICLPGVPAEMHSIFENLVGSEWQERFKAAGYTCREVYVDCGDESAIAPALRRVSAEHSEVYLKSRARTFGPDIRILVTLSSSAPTQAEAVSLVEAALADLRKALEDLSVRLLDES
jgi:molybdenum cofactor synthesis domain-containing protein